MQDILLETKRQLTELQKSIRNSLAQVHPNPLFVLGNQKSGTTAIAALLAEHTDQSVTLDLMGMYEPTQTQIHTNALSIEDFVRLNRYDFSRGIVKEPCLTFMYDKLKKTFPESLYVIVVRDPRDNIRSILNRLKIEGNLEQLHQDILRELTPEWRLVLDGTWLGMQGETYIEQLAARWNKAVDVYLDHPDEISLIRYEDFVVDKVGVIEKLAVQLGLPSVKDISSKVNVQYQPRGQRNVSWEDFFGRDNLARIEKIAGSRMQKLGYTVTTWE